MNLIPTPRIVRRLGINADPRPIPPGNFTNAVQHVWSKFNAHNGINLNAFRHNLRDYYDDAEQITQHEHNQIRAYLSDRELQICVSPAGDHFQWDNRPNAASRKCLYIDESIFFLFEITETPAQDNALQLVFMSILLHGLGDYLTSWTQPAVDFSPNYVGHGYRMEGGMKTEYAFFGGLVGGTIQDGVHYENARLRTWNSQNQYELWIIPDHIARDYYASEIISKFREVELRKFTQYTGLTNTVRQFDICCGTHRLLWRPHHRTPLEARNAYFQQQQQYYPQPPQAQQGPWYANQTAQQQPFQGPYPVYPGGQTNNPFPSASAGQYPPPPGNVGGNPYAFPPMGQPNFPYQGYGVQDPAQNWPPPQQPQPPRDDEERMHDTAGGGAT